MATANGNNAYLSFNGVNVSGYWTDEISHEISVATEDITAGAGATHVMKAAKLTDATMSFVVVYDSSTFSGYRAALVPGTVGVVIWGPEGNSTGKPKFEGSMVLTSVSGPSQTIDKQRMSFELSFEQAAVPVGTIQGGHVF